jgi:acetone carboxylase gamma subunit
MYTFQKETGHRLFTILTVGGDPIAIHCECGLTFCTDTWDWKEAVEIWNKRVNKEGTK